MADQAGKNDDTVVIKKYANRRLYNTRSSSYITLDHLAKMTREGVDYKVLDAKSGADITHQILTQIIMEEEANGEQMLPVSFLRQLIGMYGNSMQSMLPHYLEASMEHFRTNQSKIRKAFDGNFGSSPFAKLAEQNLAMFKAATTAFMPGSEKAEASQSQSDDKSGDKPGDKPGDKADDIAGLRAEMAELQKKIDSLGK